MLSAFNLYCCSNKTRLQPVQQRALICRTNGPGLCFPSKLMPPCSYFQLLGMTFGPHAHFFVQKQGNGSLGPEKTPAPKSALTPSIFRAMLIALLSRQQTAYSKPCSIIVGLPNPEVGCSQLPWLCICTHVLGPKYFEDFLVFFQDHISNKTGLAFCLELISQRQSSLTPTLLSSFNHSRRHWPCSVPNLFSSHLIPQGQMGSPIDCPPGAPSPLSQALGFQTLPIRAQVVSLHTDPAGHSSKPSTGKTGKAALLSPLT